MDEPTPLCWVAEMTYWKTVATTLALMVPAGSATALGLSSEKTAARSLAGTGTAAPDIDLNFTAELALLDSADGDVVISRQKVGGIEPTPSLPSIPVRCFKAEDGSMIVHDYRRCGVEAVITVPTDLEVTLPLDALTTVLTKQSDSTRLSVSAAVSSESDVGDLPGLVLGVLGGAEQIVAIDGENSSLIPNDISVLESNPQPEPPPRELSL